MTATSDIWGEHLAAVKVDLEGSGHWLKFTDEVNKKLRLLGTLTDGFMVRGWLAFGLDNKPIYKRDRADIPQEMLGTDQFGQPQKIKPFWTLPVYDWYAGRVALWEIRQQTLQQRLFDLTNPAAPNPQFADWRTYDVDVRYSKSQPPAQMWTVQPYQPESLGVSQMEIIKDALVGLNLDVLFEGKDPFDKLPEQPIPQPIQQEMPKQPYSEAYPTHPKVV
jgi:hypothetical protein